LGADHLAWEASGPRTWAPPRLPLIASQHSYSDIRICREPRAPPRPPCKRRYTASQPSRLIIVDLATLASDQESARLPADIAFPEPALSDREPARDFFQNAPRTRRAHHQA